MVLGNPGKGCNMTKNKKPTLALSRLAWYGLAAVTPPVAMGLRLLLERQFGPGLPPYLLFYPPVMVVAMLGGMGPGCVVTLAADLIIAFWILPPVGQLSIAYLIDRLGMLIFTIMAISLSAVASRYRNNRENASACEGEAALHDDLGRPSHVIAHVTDMTEREESEGRLHRLNEELEARVAQRTAELAAKMENLKLETAERLKAMESLHEKELMLIQQSRMAAMGEMISNLAHQWRQPLNSLGLMIQQVHMLYEYEELTKETIDATTNNSMRLIRHMSQTIEAFRNYFKPEKEMASFSVNTALANTLAIIAGSFKHENISIEVDYAADPVVYGYQNEFAQSLLNILNNSKDAIKEKGIAEPKVCIAIERNNDKAVVTISDNAGGVPEEILPKIFDPYFSTKGPHNGTGIGLYMAKSIIEKKMGGTLTVHNTGVGAQFRIEV